MSPRQRPAETTAGASAALAVLICALIGVEDPTIYGALVIVIGFIPALVTWIVVTLRRGGEKDAGKEVRLDQKARDV